MLTGFDLTRFLGLGVVTILFASAVTRAAAKGLRDQVANGAVVAVPCRSPPMG